MLLVEIVESFVGCPQEAVEGDGLHQIIEHLELETLNSVFLIGGGKDHAWRSGKLF